MNAGYGWNKFLRVLQYDFIHEEMMAAVAGHDTSRTQHLLFGIIFTFAKAMVITRVALRMTRKSRARAGVQTAAQLHVPQPETLLQCAAFVLRRSLVFTAAWGNDSARNASFDE